MQPETKRRNRRIEELKAEKTGFEEAAYIEIFLYDKLIGLESPLHFLSFLFLNARKGQV